jgi:hypothetical protein
MQHSYLSYPQQQQHQQQQPQHQAYHQSQVTITPLKDTVVKSVMPLLLIAIN